jgi:hypothetical protein
MSQCFKEIKPLLGALEIKQKAAHPVDVSHKQVYEWAIMAI